MTNASHILHSQYINKLFDNSDDVEGFEGGRPPTPIQNIDFILLFKRKIANIWIEAKYISV